MKYGLIGDTGRLGSEVKNIFNEAENNLVFSYSLDSEVVTDKPDIIIDCSLPEVFDKTIEYVNQFSVPLIIATTALSSEQFDELRRISNSVAVVQSYNFSIGIQVLLKLTSEANEYLSDWDVEISETHHRFKKDKPSGTAKMIQEKLNRNEINISSLRLGDVAGDHTVYFGGLGEVLSISHSAISRRSFAEGIYKAAQYALKVLPGYYTFSDVLFKDKK